MNAFPNDYYCEQHLEKIRWNGYVVSPFDETSKVYKCKNGKYRCKNTGKYFNVRTGTMFDNTKVSLQKWFIAIWLMTSHKKGISSLQLSKDINVTQKTAWFMLERIRRCFGSENNNELDGTVEVDEKATLFCTIFIKCFLLSGHSLSDGCLIIETTVNAMMIPPVDIVLGFKG